MVVAGDMGSWNQGFWSWKFRWRRPWFEWERRLIHDFHVLLEGVTMRRHDDDNWIWLEDP